MPLALNPLNAAQPLTAFGTAGIFLVLFAETGLLIGRRAGRALLARTRGRHVIDGVRRAEELLARYGHGRAIVLARFIPVLARTAAEPTVGSAK
ncbi:hypothetical protein ACFW95_09490 [Streptomyces sp. NPDC059474]|uniref:hypothetical protein n=1 Tax=unclassified Streptomyces TaxID=2593676 RepID=UPI0036490AA9